MLDSGSVIEGRYIVRGVIGQGGMGTVYLGHLASLANRLVAIKVVRGRFDNASEQERALEQFRREATLMATLDHPNMVRVTDFFTSNGIAYLVMDYVNGVTLAHHLKSLRSFVPNDKALDLGNQLCDVLGYFHSHTPPVVFRDLKPGNIVVTPEGRLKLVDFGIARTLESESMTASFCKGTGTHGYAPIEQYMPGQHSDVTSDIYALGATLYTIFTRAVPPAAPELAIGLATLPPPHTINPNLPSALGLLLGKMMQIHKVDRCQSIAEVREHLNKALTTAPVTKPLPVIPAEVAASPAGLRICLECGYVGAGPDEKFCTQCGNQLGRRQSAAPQGGGQVLHTWKPGRTARVKFDTENPLKTRSLKPPPEAAPKVAKPAAKVPSKPYLPAVPGEYQATAPTIQAMVQPLPGLFGWGAAAEYTSVKVVDIGPKGLTFKSKDDYRNAGSLQMKLAIPLLAAGNSIVVDVRVAVQRAEVLSSGQHQTTVKFKDLPSKLRPLLAQVLQQERRKTQRFKRSFQVVSKAMPSYRAMAVDVSARGLSMLAAGPLPAGTSLELWLDLDDTPTPGETPAQRMVRARVVYSAPQLDGRCRIGLAFESMSDSVATALFSYLKRSS